MMRETSASDGTLMRRVRIGASQSMAVPSRPRWIFDLRGEFSEPDEPAGIGSIDTPGQTLRPYGLYQHGEEIDVESRLAAACRGANDEYILGRRIQHIPCTRPSAPG